MPLLPQWFVFPTRRKTKRSLIYFWKRSKKSVHLIKHIIVRWYDVKEIFDDADCEIHSLRVCWQGNPGMSNSSWSNRHDGTYLVPHPWMMTTGISQQSQRCYPRFQDDRLQAEIMRDALAYLVCFQITVNHVHIAHCQQLINCGINLYIQKEQLTLLDDEGHPSLFAPIMIASL